MAYEIVGESCGTMDEAIYTCDECGKTKQIVRSCFSHYPREWIQSRDRDFCSQKCSDTHEVQRPAMTRRITRREWSEKYGQI